MHDPARYERIRERAYMIWLREGRPQGRDVEHWREAESEIASESRPTSSARATRQGTGADGVPEAAAPKKRSSQGSLKKDPSADSKGKPSKKEKSAGLVREPPRK